MVLRYICAAVTNQTIATYLAQAYRRSGRAAWRYLEKEFGLPSLKQTKLREDINALSMRANNDPRITAMMFDRLVNRLDPALTQKEKCELLLAKVPAEFDDIVTTIQNSAAALNILVIWLCSASVIVGALLYSAENADCAVFTAEEQVHSWLEDVNAGDADILCIYECDPLSKSNPAFQDWCWYEARAETLNEYGIVGGESQHVGGVCFLLGDLRTRSKSLLAVGKFRKLRAVKASGASPCMCTMLLLIVCPSAGLRGV